MKPAMAIAEGQFSNVGNYNIKVDKKSGKDGNYLTGITIHKKSNNFDGSKNVIRAKDGLLISGENSNIIKLVLNNGFYYEDLVPKKYEEKKNVPFAKSSFKKYTINLDLSKLNSATDEGEIANTNTMLNLNDLRYTVDSLNKNYKKDLLSFIDNIYMRTGIASTPSLLTSTEVIKKSVLKEDLLSAYDFKKQSEILKNANSNIVTTNYTIDASLVEMDNKIKVLNSHWIAIYEKFVIAFACLMMFFIGAPLGAIIRKGGLGLPIVFAVLIFIIYHFINTFGKKVAQENGLSPFLGSWMSSFVLSPLAILLTYRATNDIGLINLDVVLAPVQKLFKKIFQYKIKSN